jgi:hypothetical protein
VLNLMIKQDDDAPGATHEMGFSRRTDNDPDETADARSDARGALAGR